MKYHFCLINNNNYKHNHEKTPENLKFKVIKTITECNLWKFSCDEKKRNKQNTHTQGIFFQTERDWQEKKIVNVNLDSE